MHPGKPTPKAPPLALPPTLISGRCHVSSLRPSLPFLGPPFSRPAPPRPAPAALGSPARHHQGEPGRQGPSGGGGGWAARRSVCFWKATAAARGSWGRCLTHGPPPEPGKPSACRDAAHRGTMGTTGRGRGPRQTKALQAPPLASLPSSRCCASLPPRRLSRGLARGWGEGLGRTRVTPYPQAWPRLPPGAPAKPEPPSLQSLPLGKPPAAS